MLKFNGQYTDNHYTLLFQKRCFPYRYPFVWVIGYVKALFPKLYLGFYKVLRKHT